VACTMRRMRVASLVFLACVTSCATAPAARSPLREQLAAADTPSLRDAANDCLAKAGWKVDPFPGLSGGADVVRAAVEAVPPEWLLPEPGFQTERELRDAYVSWIVRRLAARESWLPALEAATGARP